MIQLMLNIFAARGRLYSVLTDKEHLRKIIFKFWRLGVWRPG